MEKKRISIDYTVYNGIDELPEKERKVLDKAIQATKGSYAPYSKFRVGAAVLLSNGEIVIGANQENAAYPSGLCAERTALFAAHTLYPGEKVLSIAITAVDPSGNMLPTITYPCGACRQVMAEYETISHVPTQIIIGSSNSVQVFDSVSSIMPFMFDNLV
jgi:cytidine deaminase